MLFWTDWEDGNPRIERAAMDGSNRTRIKPPGLRYPNGLAIDFSAQRLYWCDAGSDKVGSMFFDGTSQQINSQSRQMHAFGLALYRDLLFWSDWSKNTIFKAFKNGTNKVVLKRENKNPFGVRIFAKENQPGKKCFRTCGSFHMLQETVNSLLKCL